MSQISLSAKYEAMLSPQICLLPHGQGVLVHVHVCLVQLGRHSVAGQVHVHPVEWEGHPAAGQAYPVEWEGHPAAGQAHPVEWEGHPAAGQAHPVEWEGHPAAGQAHPVEWEGHPAAGQAHPVEWEGHSYMAGEKGIIP